MADIKQARLALVRRLLEGAGEASSSERQAAFNKGGVSHPIAVLVDKVATNACRVTDADFAAVLESGLSEDQIFEIVVCAAVGQAVRQYDTGFAALDAATRMSDDAATNSQ